MRGALLLALGLLLGRPLWGAMSLVRHVAWQDAQTLTVSLTLTFDAPTPDGVILRERLPTAWTVEDAVWNDNALTLTQEMAEEWTTHKLLLGFSLPVTSGVLTYTCRLPQQAAPLLTPLEGSILLADGESVQAQGDTAVLTGAETHCTVTLPASFASADLSDLSALLVPPSDCRRLEVEPGDGYASCAALGLSPCFTALAAGAYRCAFTAPTLKVQAIAPSEGSLTIQVAPAPGSAIVREPQTSALILYSAPTLTSLAPLTTPWETSDYRSLGLLRARFTPEAQGFFQLQVHTSSE